MPSSGKCFVFFLKMSESDNSRRRREQKRGGHGLPGRQRMQERDSSYGNAPRQSYVPPQYVPMQQHGPRPPQYRVAFRSASASAYTNEEMVFVPRSQLENLTKGLAISKKVYATSIDAKKTVWHTNFEANLDIPEICLFSLSKSCKFARTGCSRLHSIAPLQWQFQKSGTWYNFPKYHSVQIEASFQCPENDGHSLTHIEQNIVRSSGLMGQFESLLGKTSWTTNFDKMHMESGGTQLSIRRVSTHSSVLTTTKMATVYEWYFKDEFNNWIKYGQPNSSNKTDCVSNISSEEIEVQFAKEKVPTLKFESVSHQYIIDFKQMTQTNKETSVSRPLRRRTKMRAIKGSSTTEKALQNKNVPSTWAPMDPSKLSQMFSLNPTSSEYKENVTFIKKTLPNCKIDTVQRIQSPYLLHAFQNKKEYLKKANNDRDIEENLLFHGTDSANLSSICDQNLDWRLHGSNAGQMYGRGSYFSNR